MWCIATIIGIWPRHIEPNLIGVTHLTLPIPKLPKELEGLRILQFTDLHFQSHTPDFFLEKLSKKIMKLAPDMILFTGDFLSYSKLPDKERLLKFLSSLNAPFGCFAIFGNHDYSKCVSIGETGDYDILPETKTGKPLKVAFKRLFKKTTLTKKVTPEAQAVELHKELVELVKQTPFILLHNECKTIPIRGSNLNICGLGEYMLGRFDPEKAFKNYLTSYPGIILSHNPDTGPKLKNYPGDVILSGHTHGGQINLPLLWRKFTLMENQEFKKGLFKLDDKWMYVNRGIGSTLPFRWFAMPELLLLTLTGESHEK